MFPPNLNTNRCCRALCPLMVIFATWTSVALAYDYEDFVHLDSGPVGSVNTDFYYETTTPYGDETVWGFDLISEPTTPITRPWGNKTGLFVPQPYGSYGLGRSSSQPTTYFQIYNNEVGICLDVQSDEIGSQTYNPMLKFHYFWNYGSYGLEGSTGWLYPFHSSYTNPNPVMIYSFDAAVKTSSGSTTGARHAHTSFQWVDYVSGGQIYTQHYVYDNRGVGLPDVGSGIDPKMEKLWIFMKTGASNAYHDVTPESAVYTGTTWSDYRHFEIETSWSQFHDMIVYLNNKHDMNFGLDRDKWRLAAVNFNFEMQQGYKGSLAGKIKDMKVWTRD